MARLLVPVLILAEIASLILVGRAVGVLLTLLLVVLGAGLGVAILRGEGREALARMRGSLRAGGDPRPALLRGGFRLAAALLLVLPGFFSDAVALALVLPPVQRVLTRWLARAGGRIVGARGAAFEPHSPRPIPPRDRVPEAEWEEVAPPRDPRRPPSGWTQP